MKLELIKVKSDDVHSGFWVRIDGVDKGAISAPDAQALSDHVNIQQMASEGYQAPLNALDDMFGGNPIEEFPTAPTIYTKHEGEG